MTELHTARSDTAAVDVDAVVVGAGFSGLYMLRRLRDLGLSARAFEAGDDVGGTWYWNRYPGARSDSDSTVYCFSDRFDEQTMNEWRWSERYPTQREIHGYLRWLADRYDLRRLITFSTKVTAAAFADDSGLWSVTTDSGECVRTRYLVLAVGALSKPHIPDFPGLETFGGQWSHTARMPAGGLDYAGKRVAVIGSGATGVQIVPVVAHEAAHVYAFSRHPYHCLPGRNHVLDDHDWDEITRNRKRIWERARREIGGFPYEEPYGPAGEFPPERIREVFEDCWRKGGFRLANSSFADVITNEDTNKIYLDFLRVKLESVLRRPELVDKLMPTEPFLSKRPPIEHGYYSAFNRDNVSLVDLRENPIGEFTPSGIRMADGTEYDVDVAVLATGFDAITGALLDMDVRGRDGLRLADKWAEKPTNYLGMAVAGFPNMFMLYCGPYNPAILANGPTLIELQGEWLADCLAHLRAGGITSIEAQPEAEDRFVRLSDEFADATLIPRTASWWTGTNVEGKPRGLRSWVGGLPEYSRVLAEAGQDYTGFVLTKG
ncbi:MAG TPA: NAD(P)/FAD-dependent oxidoreductase [Amycolatopsis sp.]|nr:NAD(P)/FAD-dependent oxidoreductase [Amycolatopsis sp.]